MSTIENLGAYAQEVESIYERIRSQGEEVFIARFILNGDSQKPTESYLVRLDNRSRKKDKGNEITFGGVDWNKLKTMLGEFSSADLEILAEDKKFAVVPFSKLRGIETFNLQNLEELVQKGYSQIYSAPFQERL